LEHLLVVVALLLTVLGVALLIASRRASHRGSWPWSARLQDDTPGALPYRKKDQLLTRAEHSFYSVLHRAVGAEFHIFPKVRLVDLVWVPRATRGRQRHLNRVLSKHVDFVLCHPVTLAPLLAVELDDASHEREARRARDAFVDDVLHTAGLPTLHVRAAHAYVPSNLAELVRREMGHAQMVQAGASHPQA
jgi:hypothetical protein